jgi:SAM-dependent methyltransferase
MAANDQAPGHQRLQEVMSMARIEPFEEHALEYDAWFDAHPQAYESELQAVRSLLPVTGRIVEVGVGTGRFAAPLGITLGVEPSAEMRRRAAARAVETLPGTGESLPFDEKTMDAVVMVTVLCFLDDVETAFNEVYRVLKPSGCFVVGFVDRTSRIGRFYEHHRDASPFYRVATFYSVQEVELLLKKAGFRHLHVLQTLFHDLEETVTVEPATEGSGEGSFVVIRAEI